MVSFVYIIMLVSCLDTTLCEYVYMHVAFWEWNHELSEWNQKHKYTGYIVYTGMSKTKKAEQ